MLWPVLASSLNINSEIAGILRTSVAINVDVAALYLSCTS